MKLRIHVKGAGRRQNKLTEIVYDYPLQEMSVEEFLTETVRQTVRAYNARGEKGETESGEFLQLFLKPVHRADEQTAVSTALQAFEDGMVAVFVDGERYTERAQKVRLTPQSDATFVRLTFLAGRIW